MNRDILLEIGTEEIPAGYISPSIKQLENIAETELNAVRLEYKNVNVWATPRRLILYCENVAEQQSAHEMEISGPSENAAFAEGKPTHAAIGFAKKYGVDVSELVVKNGKVHVLKKEPLLKTEAVLGGVFKKIISSLTFPKTMVWESSRFKFVRPIRWILALYGKKTIKFQIADVKSSNYTCAGYGKKIKINDPQKFADILRNKSVLVKPLSRLEALKKTVLSAVKNNGEISGSDVVFETVNNLVEYPTAILCRFDEKFLNLPEEIIVNTIKKQKNFVVIDGKTKKILTHFVAVKNGISTNLDTIKEGYEKVIAARLEDVEFYFKNDIKTKLDEKIDRLKGIVFQEKLGTIYDKVERIKKSADWLNEASQLRCDPAVIERLCLLCKADLSTETVSELPELQGAFGKICALRDGETEIVAEGIEQHWWPLNYDGKIPESYEACVVSAADKSDTLVGDFALGLIPTGSADPYGLRRAAFGIIKIAVEKKLSFSLRELLIQTITNLPFAVSDRVKIMSQIDEFIKQRFATYLKEKNIRPDEVDAVLSVRLDNILDVYNRAVAINSIRKLPDFEPLATSFKRIGNILKQAEKSETETGVVPPDYALFTELAEKILYEKYLSAKENVEKTSGEGDYKQALSELVLLRKPVDDFFDKVLIMDKNESVRTNRLKLLTIIYNQFVKIADFSKIVPEK